ncbi:hypothetical protein SSX86_022665 [Deinandra increscens subsp. villosa]|uniref:Uncharacterized protein n=1 Tax=Deinandra increscens subsp. villosa TaxID=3103831 RepID=A0AAP0CPD6_9ASTR
MAYRRRQGLSRSSTFKDEILRPPDQDDATTSSAAPPHTSSDPRLDSFRSSGAFHSSFKNRFHHFSSATFDDTSMRSMNEPRGFWGVLARKATSILKDDNPHQSNTSGSKKPETVSFSTSSQFTGIKVHHQYESLENSRKTDNRTLSMRLDRIMPTINQIGDAIGNALEEEKKTQDIVYETQSQRNQETQLQASRNVAMATAAKVKQLARELKTVTEELELAKERCCQLEEENKLLREGREQSDHSADDMIRVQLETLLAEKGRLAHENSVFARENRYLREIVEFHQMNMRDMVYLDEGIKETTQDPATRLDL